MIFRKLAYAIGFAGFLTGCAAPVAFSVAVIGDQQYDAESETHFSRLIDHIDRSDVSFVVHVGDFKPGGAVACDDDLFRKRYTQFNESRHPLIYTPGDNEWTDCHNPKAGGYRPLEALDRLRRIFYADEHTLGQRRIRVRRQSAEAGYSRFRENALWSERGVTFATLHMVGDNNNLGRTREDDGEYAERNAANLAWLGAAFSQAAREHSRAVVLFTQANPRFEYRFPQGRIRALGAAEPPGKPNGFAAFLDALEREVVAFGKPVLLVHGDTHYFRIDKPLFRTGETGAGSRGRQIENFTRAEVFGFPDAHWLKIIIDPAHPAVFSYQQQIVDEHRFRGR